MSTYKRLRPKELFYHQISQGETEPASFCWTYEEIKEVHKRWWQLRDNAVEIFLTNGRTLLLAFDNTKVQHNTAQPEARAHYVGAIINLISDAVYK